MARYAVTVEVTYHVTATDPSKAIERVESGAEFPLVPYVDEDYVSEDRVVRVLELSKE